MSVIWKVHFSMLIVATLGIAAGLEQAGAAEPEVDKSAFTLFNPTPARLLREMDTDGRPGSAESPYTVDAGHFQLEMTWVSYSSDRESVGGVTRRTEEWDMAPTTLKIGLLNRLDAQLLLEPYNVSHERADGTRVTRRGFGDTTVRLKYNLWGNDGGRTALAATPYVTFPTSQEGIGDRGFEGGLVVPFAAELPREFYLGLTTRFDAVRDESDSRYHAEFVNSIAFGHDLSKRLFAYVEFKSAMSTVRNADWEGTFDVGLIYDLTKNLQLNSGANIGVTRSVDDWQVYVGMAWRF